MKHGFLLFLIVTTAVFNYLYSVFGSEGRLAYAVMMAESSGNETSVSPTGDYGLMQINLSAHWSEIPGTTADKKIQGLFNPYNNINEAKSIRGRYGWSQWSVYTSEKWYLQYYYMSL